MSPFSNLRPPKLTQRQRLRLHKEAIRSLSANPLWLAVRRAPRPTGRCDEPISSSLYTRGEP